MREAENTKNTHTHTHTHVYTKRRGQNVLSCQHLVRDWKNQVIMQDFSPREKEFERNIDGGGKETGGEDSCVHPFSTI